MTWLLGSVIAALALVLAGQSGLLWYVIRRRDAAADALEPMRKERDTAMDSLASLREEYQHALDAMRATNLDADKLRRENVVLARQRDRLLAQAVEHGDAGAVAASIRAELQALDELAGDDAIPAGPDHPATADRGDDPGGVHGRPAGDKPPDPA